jgi:hypothetical protein
MKDYQKRANDNYRSKFDIVQIRLVKGTKEQIINKTGKSISQYIQDLIDKDLHNNFDLPYTAEYRPNVTESSRKNENDFDGKIIDNDIKIDSRAFKKHVPTEEEETDNRMRLLKLQEEINARKTYIIKPVEQEPTMTDIKLPDKPPF